MSTLGSLVNEVLISLHGMGLTQPRAAFLTSPLASGDSVAYVGDASYFTQGVAEIGGEIVFIESVDRVARTLTFSPDGRGYYGTTAAAHDTGTRIEMGPLWPRHVVRQRINEAIIGTYPDLFGVATTTFTYNPSVNTYALPAGAERVLRVATAVPGSSNEKVRINRYYSDGGTLTLEQAGWPGQTVTVTYASRPVELAGEADDFTDSGLSETAKTAVSYAACSHLLSYVDASRLNIATAQADEYDPSRSAIGQAQRLSIQLYQRYELELRKEKDRLREQWPTPINVRTR